MGEYRLYFRDRSGGIVGIDEFQAGHDGEATEIAEHLGEACSDLCDSFQLWQNARLVATRQRLEARALRTAVVNAMQESLIEREECIRNSRWRIAESRKLLSRLDEARRGLGSPATAATRR